MQVIRGEGAFTFSSMVPKLIRAVTQIKMAIMS